MILKKNKFDKILSNFKIASPSYDEVTNIKLKSRVSYFKQVVEITSNCIQITPLTVLGNNQKEIFKKLHSWLPQASQHGHHPHLLNLEHLHGLAETVYNIFEKFLFNGV